MIYKTNCEDTRNAKYFCKLWRKKYYRKYKELFSLNWFKDPAYFRKLLSSIPPKKLEKIVEFAFLTRKETEFLFQSLF